MQHHEHMLVIELAVVAGSAPKPSQALWKALQPSAIPAIPVQLPGSGPSAIENSISGCAHALDVKSPRSQLVKIERISSTFVEAIEQVWRLGALRR